MFNPLKFILFSLSLLKKNYESQVRMILWRKLNPHNDTILIDFTSTDYNKIEVGFRSYGELNVYSYDNDNEFLKIGNYVSIAKNVKFILGGNHMINGYTTFPVKSVLLSNDPEKDAVTKGVITIEDEVWIGFGATILSGVQIGKGAIIAAGSVVVKNVDAFSIVAGNPAKIIKYRISPDLISKRVNRNLIDFDEEYIIKNIDLFYKKLDLQTLQILHNTI